jgi:hypothetical protein
MAELEETQAELQRTVSEIDQASSRIRFGVNGSQTPAAEAEPTANPWGIERPAVDTAPTPSAEEEPQDPPASPEDNQAP